jgi:hypothetical protein
MPVGLSHYTIRPGAGRENLSWAAWRLTPTAEPITAHETPASRAWRTASWRAVSARSLSRAAVATASINAFPCSLNTLLGLTILSRLS